MSKEDRVIVDMLWLTNGEKDPLPEYATYKRENLMGAHLFSDDELANKLSMMSTISDDQDMARMLDSHKNDGDYVCKSSLGEIAKDRLRWLTRRVAILEGRYPGVEATKEAAKNLVVAAEEGDAYNIAIAEARLERQVPLLAALVNLPPGTHPNNVAALLEERNIDIDSLKLCTALGMFLQSKPIQRWQIYVAIARDLLKRGYYIPFWDDEYTVSTSNVLTIQKSKYHNTSKSYRLIKMAAPEVVVPTVASIFNSSRPVELTQAELAEEGFKALVDDNMHLATEKAAQEIYDSWKDQDGWVPWVENGNSVMQDKARREAVGYKLTEQQDNENT